MSQIDEVIRLSDLESTSLRIGGASLIAHVIWDWNGTLVDDLSLTIESVNRVLDDFGAAPISADQYRMHYRRPVVRFYESLLGRTIDTSTWSHINSTFHDHYDAHAAILRLAPVARASLAAVAGLGRSQSLLSMWSHGELEHEVRRHAISRYFTHVEGHGSRTGDTKYEHLAAHLERLDIRDPRRILVVGDAGDDAAAARAVGAQAALVASGTQDPFAFAGTVCQSWHRLPK